MNSKQLAVVVFVLLAGFIGAAIAIRYPSRNSANQISPSPDPAAPLQSPAASPDGTTVPRAFDKLPSAMTASTSGTQPVTSQPATVPSVQPSPSTTPPANPSPSPSPSPSPTPRSSPSPPGVRALW